MSRSLILPATAAIAVSVAIAPRAIAQLVPDTTLPTNSTVTPTPDGVLIDGGSSQGSNLFHSFQEFSLPTGTAAFFNNSPAIENIITRVTGGEISNIDGVLGANGSANVFLLNPNGIVFGENARLAIGGSFFATTAESLQFADGFEFSASTPEIGSPLLTLNVPVGLQFGSNPGSIQVLGSFRDPLEVPTTVSNSAEQLAVIAALTLDPLERPLNLTVLPGETLTLAGGDIVVEGAQLAAPGGRIVLGSVGPESQLGITSTGELTYDRVSSFRDLDLTHSATVNASGGGGGRLQLQAGRLRITDKSFAIAYNLDNEQLPFSGIDIKAEELAIAGQSGISSLVLAGGDGGDMSIQAETLTLSDRTTITTSSNGPGDAGDLAIRAADSIAIDGSSSIITTTAPTLSIVLGSGPLVSGSGGDLDIQARNLTLSNTGAISSASLLPGAGAGGNLNVEVLESIVINPGPPLASSETPGALFSSGLTSSTAGAAKAGDISIATERLTINAAGTEIPTPRSSIASTTSGAGSAGEIFIQAGVLEAIGTPGGSAQISLQGRATASGSAGNLNLVVGDLILRDGGQLLVGHEGEGDGGTLSAIAETARLENGGRITAASRSGRGGEIQLQIDDRLTLSDGTGIDATAGFAGAAGDGGNIELSAEFIIAQPEQLNQLSANAFEGLGGNITIETEALFGNQFLEISVSSELGIESAGTIAIELLEFDLPLAILNLPDAPLDISDRLVDRCAPDDRGRFTLAGRGGIPPTPESAPHDETLLLARLALDGNKASAESRHFQGDRILAVVREAQQLRSRGFYRRALERLEQLVNDLPLDTDLRASAIAWRHYGITLGLSGKQEASREALQRSLEIARAIGSDDDIGAALLGLGNLLQAVGESDRALHYYQRSAERAIAPSLNLQALLNQFNLFVETQQLDLALPLQAPIRAHLDALPPSRTSVFSRLHYLDRLLEVSPQNPDIAPLLDAAERQAKTAQDERSLAYVLGLRGRIYESREQWQLAREATERALFLSQNLDAPDLEYQWQWQLGRIFRELGDRRAAIVAYNNAVAHLKFLRSDLASTSSETQFSFRDRVEPVYRQLVSLLLDGESPAQENLQQARSLIEALQVAQLDNFFQDDCSQATPVQVDRIDPKAAVVYPIVLPERLAVIVSMAGQPLRYYSHPVGDRELAATVRELRALLLSNPQNTRPVLLEQTSQQVYDWLVEPLVPQLEAQGIETLVFVLDGVLRNLPMSALFDGENYLIERYNVAIAPGLELLASNPLEPQGLNLLAGGISQARQGFADLPGVKLEIENITDRIERSRALLDEEFTVAQLQGAIAQRPFNVLHLATHGQFGATAEETFILTWEDRLNVRELGELLQRYTRRDAIELLVLSACETATGDERAVLGIAGVAVRSGARTTLAGLWPLDDATAVAFTDRFYQALSEPGTTKAEAFRQAQRELMNDDRFNSPFFWAPFVLVGNWR